MISRHDLVVLVVDDSDTSRALVKAALAQVGYAVVSVSSAAEALVILDSASQQYHVDVLITDINLGGNMNGQQLAKHVHASMPRGIRPRILALTADSTFEPETGEFEAVLFKPYTITDLQRMVDKLVGEAKQAP